MMECCSNERLVIASIMLRNVIWTVNSCRMRSLVYTKQELLHGSCGTVQYEFEQCKNITKENPRNKIKWARKRNRRNISVRAVDLCYQSRPLGWRVISS